MVIKIKKCTNGCYKSIAILVYLPDLAKAYWTNSLAVGTIKRDRERI